MDTRIGKDIENKEKRIAYLSDNSNGVENKNYMKRFTHDQLQQMKEKLSEVAIQINDVERKRKLWQTLMLHSSL